MVNRKVIIISVLLCVYLAINAQDKLSVLNQQVVRKYVARNFSSERTFNFNWAMSANHDYTLLRNNELIENGRSKNIHALKFATKIPVLRKKNFTLYVSGKFSSYQFESFDRDNKLESLFFNKKDDGYSFNEASVMGSYNTQIFGKSILLMASFNGDWGNKRFGEISGQFSAIMPLSYSATQSLSVGFYATTLFNKVPLIPIVVFTHQFSPSLLLDITLPSQSFLRYQFNNNQRISIGASLDNEQYYMSPNIPNLPKVTYFTKTSVKPEIVYEYIINDHFYFNARCGVAKTITGGLYKKNRKEVNGNPFLKYKEPVVPFFNVGISYNIF